MHAFAKLKEKHHRIQNKKVLINKEKENFNLKLDIPASET